MGEIFVTNIAVVALVDGATTTRTTTVPNVGDGELEYQINVDRDWLSVQPARGTVSAFSAADINVSVTCPALGVQEGSLTIVADDKQIVISVQSKCNLPIDVVVITSPEPGLGDPTSPISAETSWRLSTSWQGEIPPLTYTISDDHEDIAISPTSGSVAIDEIIAASILANCADQASFISSINILISGTNVDTQTTIPWNVRCQAGNVAYDGIEFYQGPRAWKRNLVLNTYTQNTPTVAGRRAALATLVTHDSPTVPLVVARLLGQSREIVVERLNQLTIPRTRAPSIITGNKWQTEYVFDLPGNLNQSGNSLDFSIDPENTIDETNEGDNYELIALAGQSVPVFDIVFIPVRTSAGVPSIVVEEYMRNIYDFLPIVDNYRARVGATYTLISTANGGTDIFVDTAELVLDEIYDLWNREAESHEFYHGIFLHDGGPTCGIAFLPGNVGVSANIERCGGDTLAHEVGHNLGLNHAPGGCGEDDLDNSYPYVGARLGLNKGWWFSRSIFVNPDDDYVDMMSYCFPSFVSDYNFGRATINFSTRSLPPLAITGTDGVVNAARSKTPKSATISSSFNQEKSSASVTTASNLATLLIADTSQAEMPKSLALTGSMKSGKWRLNNISLSYKSPRQPLEGALYTLVLQDSQGQELYREPLMMHRVSDAGASEALGWAARVPLHPVDKLIILDNKNMVVLDEHINVPNYP